MTIHLLKPPGDALGPCKGKCIHPSCVEIRQVAQTRCTSCNDSIGYNRAYVELPDGTLQHTECLNREVDQLR